MTAARAVRVLDRRLRREDLGTSLGSGQPVTDFISGRAGNSLTLALLALVVLFAVWGSWG